MRLGCIIAGAWLASCSVSMAGDRVSERSSCRLMHCQVTLIDEVDVPAQEAGLLMSIEAREGMRVQADMLLAQIDDKAVKHQKRVAELEHKSALAKAASDVNVRHARASSAVAAADYQSVASVNKRNPSTISQSEQRKKELEFRTAELRIEQSELEQQVAVLTSDSKAAEADAAQAAIDRRRVLAPLDGIIVEVTKRPGEWVQPGERIARIVRMDRLRVEGFVKAAEFDAEELDNRPVVIEVQMARGRVERFEGKITFVDPQLQGSGEFRICAEVRNRTKGEQFMLRPGSKVEMTIETGD